MFLAQNTTRAEDYNWVTNTDLRFSLIKDGLDMSSLPSTISTKQIDCFNTSLVIKSSALFSLIPEQKVNVCAHQTGIGVIGNNYLQSNSTNIAGPLKLRVNGEFLVPAQNANSFIILNNSAPTGSYVYYIKSLQIKTTVNYDSTVSHAINNPLDVKTVYATPGQRLTANYDTVSYSANAKWAVFDSPYFGQVRMNMDDGSILPFGDAIDYSYGNPVMQTSISNDGRFAVISMHNNTKIYDLQSCVSKINNLYVKNCTSRQVDPERLQKTESWGTIMTIVRFTSDRSITYYSAKSVSGKTTYRQYRLTMGDVPLNGMSYLGLGDSFASGEGSFNYKPLTDVKDNMCHVSQSSYPFILGSTVTSGQYNSVACSGAKSKDVFSNIAQYKGQYGDLINQEQRSNINDLLSSFTPGKITQQTFVAEKTPEAVTISIGGNDIGFAEKLKSCIYKSLDDTCFNSYEDRVEVVTEIKNIIPDLVNTYRNIKNSNTRVYVLGYPKLVQPGGNCANNVKLNNSEIDFADKLVNILNDAIETATKQAGVVYVDVEDMLNGHKLCETESENVYVHGISEAITKFYIGDDFNLAAKESFHPKVQAQQLFASAISSQTQNLTKPMPAEDQTANFQVPASSDSFWQVTKKNRSIYTPVYSDPVLPSDIYYRNDQINVNLTNSLTAFKPLSSVNLELHSSPVNLGTMTTDSAGNLSGQITIPNNIEPGYHSLHFYGENVTGEKIDIYDYVFIGVNDTDFDGDGILNKDESCILVSPDGQDDDKDGIDNACDDVLNPLPPAPVDPVDNSSGSTDGSNNQTTGSSDNTNQNTDSSGGNNSSGGSGTTDSSSTGQTDNQSNTSSSGDQNNSSTDTNTGSTQTGGGSTTTDTSTGNQSSGNSSNTNSSSSDNNSTNQSNSGSTNQTGNQLPEKIIGNNETVAGNEQLALAPSNQPQNSSSSSQNSNTSQSSNTATQQSSESSQPTPTDNNVLGDKTAKPTDNKIIDKQVSNLQNITTHKNSYKYFYIAGAIILISTIILAVLRRRNQQVDV